MVCVFCDIVSGHAESHIVWEDPDHLAFLSIYPNTYGVTVVVPKEHYSSYVFDQDDAVITALLIATKKVARLLDDVLTGVARTAMVFEGYGVDHLHAKLYPMHGTGERSDFQRIASDVGTYIDQYSGFVSSHDGPRAEHQTLAALARRLRGHGSA
ncbi:HIT family protein [Pseudomonas sp. PSKL.D1]|uniref:HIT family protein n=1 Tax=Pseudomonas sp. PSKL.D1 TaxID=3029060 RepID=UPI0023817D95|nr:HIT family protein [Pseudomonas sp. PSKL.D1]WDY57530.1 HIT family protein [Pseudomonas sp. PSKL.D1]